MRTMKFILLICIVCFALVTLAACGERSNNSNSTASSGSKISLKDAPADVQTVYKSYCMSCHAIDLSGKMGESTNLQQVHTKLTFEEIVDKLNRGGKTMPAFEDRLSAEEIKGLASWLAKQ